MGKLFHYFYKEGCKISDVSEKERSLIVTLSDRTQDRYDEIMNIDGVILKNFVGKNAPHLWMHNMKEHLPPLGLYQWVRIIERKLRGKILFMDNEFSMSIHWMHTHPEGKKVKFLNGISIGFDPKIMRDGEELTDKEKKNGVSRVHESWELLEGSSVTVGANPNALSDAYAKGRIPDIIYKDFNELLEEKDPLIQYKTFINGADFEEEPESKEDEPEPQEDKTDMDIEFGELLSDEDVKFISEEKPFPNEHSARLQDPKKFNPETFRRKKDGTIYGRIKVPNTVAVIWGKIKGRDKPADNPIPQALRFPTKDWTVIAAKKWLKDNNIKFISFEPAGKEFGGETSDEEKIGKDLIELIGEEIAIKVIKEEIGLLEALEEFDKQKKEKEKEIDLDFEDDDKSSQSEEPEKSDEIDLSDLTEEDAKEIGEKIGEEVIRGFRKNVLGKVDNEPETKEQ